MKERMKTMKDGWIELQEHMQMMRDIRKELNLISEVIGSSPQHLSLVTEACLVRDFLSVVTQMRLQIVRQESLIHGKRITGLAHKVVALVQHGVTLEVLEKTLREVESHQVLSHSSKYPIALHLRYLKGDLEELHKLYT